MASEYAESLRDAHVDAWLDTMAHRLAPALELRPEDTVCACLSRGAVEVDGDVYCDECAEGLREAAE